MLSDPNTIKYDDYFAVEVNHNLYDAAKNGLDLGVLGQGFVGQHLEHPRFTLNEQFTAFSGKSESLM